MAASEKTSQSAKTTKAKSETTKTKSETTKAKSAAKTKAASKAGAAQVASQAVSSIVIADEAFETTAPAADVHQASLAPSAVGAVIEFQPEAKDIAVLAYSLWEKRGFAHGGDVSDWFAAEAMLKG
ncbi:MAG: DUF2934 domain-containing protein [Candidatus Melainabacteria bacterium]|nr:DUF2934 domain-containing protein [Candidatus Melainabacteria bacterium]